MHVCTTSLCIHLFVLGFFFLFFWPHGTWILVPQPRTEPVASAVEGWSLNHWTAKEVPIHSSIDGHLGGFHILAAAKKASANTEPYSFLMLSNLTFGKSLQNLSRKQILFSRGYSFQVLENPPPAPPTVPFSTTTSPSGAGLGSDLEKG